jgi:hypothetical protein
MVAVEAIFLFGFLVIATTAVLSVVADDSTEPATVAILALPPKSRC